MLVSNYQPGNLLSSALLQKAQFGIGLAQALGDGQGKAGKYLHTHGSIGTGYHARSLCVHLFEQVNRGVDDGLDVAHVRKQKTACGEFRFEDVKEPRYQQG